MAETKSSFIGSVLFYLSAHIVAAYLFRILRPYLEQFLAEHPEIQSIEEAIHHPLFLNRIRGLVPVQMAKQNVR